VFPILNTSFNFVYGKYATKKKEKCFEKEKEMVC